MAVVLHQRNPSVTEGLSADLEARWDKKQDVEKKRKGWAAPIGRSQGATLGSEYLDL